MRAIIAFLILSAFAPAFAQQQYIGPPSFGPRPQTTPQIDCRAGPAIKIPEPESKIQPALTWGHVGRFASVTSPCIRVDYWVASTGRLQLVFYDETGEAFDANINVGPSAVFAQGFLRDAFGNVRGNIFIQSLNGGCSRLYVRAVVDNIVVIPPAPADLELFVRYVSAPNNPCVP